MQYSLIKKLSTATLVLAIVGFSIGLPKQAAAKQLLTQADFKYIGAFSLPATVSGGGDPTFGRGMALRYVNGQLRMFSGTWNPQGVYEVTVPTPSLTSTPSAQVVKYWGTIWGNKWSGIGGGNTVELYGLYWDETDKRLYWSFGGDYLPPSTDPPLGYSTLNDATGTATAYGPWSFSGKTVFHTDGCVMAIPDWFANAYTGGKRLGVGCGGYFSGALMVSWGPALAAFSPPSGSGGALSSVGLVRYPDAGADSDIYVKQRVHRDTNYQGTGNWVAWAPQGSIGYWTAGDYLYQGGVWIDTPEKSGLLYFPVLGTGKVYYQNPGMYLAADGSSHWWYMYDPADLARVAQGQVAENMIQPVAEWPVKYPDLGVNYNLGGFTGGAMPKVITGAAYDPSTRRLYVGIPMAASGGGYGTTKVYVYEVQSGTTPPPTTKTGDLNNDGKVDIFDYNLLVGNFGKTGTGIVGDIDNNGKVDIFDYNLLVGNFGK